MHFVMMCFVFILSTDHKHHQHRYAFRQVVESALLPHLKQISCPKRSKKHL